MQLRAGVASCRFFGEAQEKRSFNIRYEFCVVAAGCGWGPLSPAGESPWKPSSLQRAQEASAWSKFDERTVSGRLRRIQQEHKKLWELHDAKSSVLVVGGDYLAVEWVCELRHHFPQVAVTLVSPFLRCLMHLPVDAAEYAQQHMDDKGVRCFYNTCYEPNDPSFWDKIGLSEGADEDLRPVSYVLNGVAARNTFLPLETLSAGGPDRKGGWIVTNPALQICSRRKSERPGQPWAAGRVFAAGDCHFGAVVGAEVGTEADPFAKFAVPPVPKTAFAAARWAAATAWGIAAVHTGRRPDPVGWPREAGIIAVSLGPEDGLVVWKVDWRRNSGEVILTGQDAVRMKRSLDWPEDRDVLAEPNRRLPAFQGGLSGGRRCREKLRAFFGLQSRAW